MKNKNIPNYENENCQGFEVPSFARTVYDLKGTKLLLFSLIHSYTIDQKTGGWLKASQSKISEILNISVPVVIKNLKSLQDDGLIEIKKTQTGNAYPFIRYICSYRTINQQSTDKNIKYIRRGDSFTICYDLLKQDLTADQVLVASRIKRWCLNGNSACYASEEAIAAWVGCSVRTVKRALTVLVSKNIIKIHSGLYLFTDLYNENIPLKQRIKQDIAPFDYIIATTLNKAGFFSFLSVASDKTLVKYYKKFSIRFNNIHNLVNSYSKLIKKLQETTENKLNHLIAKHNIANIPVIGKEFASLINLAKYNPFYIKRVHKLIGTFDTEGIIIIDRAFNKLEDGINAYYRDNNLICRLALLQAISSGKTVDKWVALIIKKSFMQRLNVHYIKKMIHSDLEKCRYQLKYGVL